MVSCGYASIATGYTDPLPGRPHHRTVHDGIIEAPYPTRRDGGTIPLLKIDSRNPFEDEDRRGEVGEDDAIGC